MTKPAKHPDATHQPARTCEQRIVQQINNRLAELIPDVSTWSAKRCTRHLQDEGRTVPSPGGIDTLRDEVTEAIREQAFDNLLSVEAIRTYKLCLSYGGPADYFELRWSELSHEWIGGRYLYQDWFDGAQRPISSEQAERIGEVFNILPEYD